jgi:hypothetical protein
MAAEMDEPITPAVINRNNTSVIMANLLKLTNV